MELQIGMVVKSISGHDEGFYLVVKIDREFVYLCNGRSRLLEKPKKKNRKHVRATNHVVEIAGIKTDRKLREVLWGYNFGGTQVEYTAL